MKILMIVESRHLGNTRKVVDAMNEVVPMTIVDTKGATTLNLDDFDLLGFASGIYMGRHDVRLLKFANTLPFDKRPCFIVSTSGGQDYTENNKTLINILEHKNKDVLGVYSCLGLDKFFVLRLMGGMNKGHPDQTELKQAQDFIVTLVGKIA
ncbi:MAG: hypothetical protein EOM77_03690 [Bacteroidia bacterium]|nr:hypothetical protein [Bacteroidia bacterium]